MKEPLHRYVVYDTLKNKYLIGEIKLGSLGEAKVFSKVYPCAYRAAKINQGYARLSYSPFGLHEDIISEEGLRPKYSYYDLPHIGEVRKISICPETGTRKFLERVGFGSLYNGIVEDKTLYTFRNGNPNSDDLLFWIKNKSDKAPKSLADELGASGQRYGFMINQNDWHDNFG